MTEILQADSGAKGSNDSLFVRAAKEYRTNLADGKSPNIDQYAQRYPEIADVIREVFPVFARFPVFELAEVESDDVDGSDEQKGRVPKMPKVLGDYQLVREIGRGGMGIVYEAHQISLDKKVALKILPFAGVLDPRSLQRFQNEAKAAAQLQHPNIVPVHAVGCDRGTHFYAMRFIEGHNLAQVIRQLQQVSANQDGVRPLSSTSTADHVEDSIAATAPMPIVVVHASGETARSSGLMRFKSTKASVSNVEYLRSFVELAIQVAEALQHAHNTGIVHRDIKPSNLMLDTTGNVWITDFGLAQIRGDTNITVTGDMIGTLRYMSPEQALAKRVIVDHRTDIYSLGAMLYELLTLRPAFDGATREQVMRQIAFEEPVPPRKIDKRIPPELEVIVTKALTKNPDERYQSVQELADDLRRYQSDEPIRARAPTVSQRLGKWTKRHRNLVLSGVLLSFVVFIAALISSWQVFLAYGAEKEARQTAESLLLQSEGSRLAIFSVLDRTRSPGRALSLAVEGRRRYASAETNNAVLRALDENYERKTLRGHERAVGSVDYSTDGKLLVTAGVRKAAPSAVEPAVIWDANTGALLRRLQTDVAITSAAFSPSSGRILASYAPFATRGQRDESRDSVGIPPAVYDATTAAKLVELNGAFLPRAHPTCFSPNGQFVVTPTLGNKATVFDVVEGFRQTDLVGHSQRVDFAAFSPSGKYIVTISQDKTARIWLASSGKELHRLTAWKIEPPEMAIFSPNEQYLATASDEGAHLWEVASGRNLNSNQWVGNRVAFTPDSKRAVTAMQFTNEAQVYDTTTGEKIFDFKNLSGDIRAMDVNATGEFVAVACSNEIEVRSIFTGARRALLRGHDSTILTLCFAPSQPQLASGSGDQTTRIWSIRSGVEQRTIQSESEVFRQNLWAFSPPKAFAPQPDRMVVLHTNPRTWYSFDVKNRRRTATYDGQFAEGAVGGDRLVTIDGNVATVFDHVERKKIISHTSRFADLSLARLSNDGKTALLVSGNGAAILWDVEKDRTRELPAHSDHILDASFDEKGDYFATACRDGSVRLWKLSGELFKEWKMPGSANWVRFNHAGDKLIAATSQSAARVWNIVSGEQLFDLADPSTKFSRAYFSAGDKYIVTFDWYDNVALGCWQATDGKLVRTFGDARGTVNVALAHHAPLAVIASRELGLFRWNFETGDAKHLEKAAMKFAAFEPDDRRVIAATFTPAADPEFTPQNSPPITLSPRLQVWDAVTDQMLESIPTQLGLVTHLQVRPDGELLVAAKLYGASIFEVPGQKKLADVLGHSGPLAGLAFADNGKSIVTASSDQTLGIWDSSTGNLKHWLDGHQAGITAMALSPSGQEVASGSSDGEVLVWSIEGKQLRKLSGHKDLIYHILYSPNGEQILTNSRDGNVRLWNNKNETIRIIPSAHGVFIAVDWSTTGEILAVPGGERIATQMRISAQFPDAASLKEKIKPGAPAKLPVYLYRTTGAAPIELEHTSAPKLAAFNSDGTRIVTTDQNTAYVWSVGDRPERLLTIRKHNSQMDNAYFSPDGKYLLTMHSGDFISSIGDRSEIGNNAYLWNAETGEEIASCPASSTLTGRLRFINPRANPFTPNSDWVISIEEGVTLRRWPTDIFGYGASLVPAELTPAERAVYRIPD